MGVKLSSGGHTGMDEINVTPLIDVVLVLLIIFMVLTPITMRTMANQLPPKDDSPPPPPPEKPPDQLIVAVYADGSLALNLQSFADDELFHQIQLRLPGMERKTVFIDAAPDAKYARVVEVMDRVREVGAEKVGLSDLKEEGPAPPLAAGQAPIIAPSAPAAPAPAP